MGFLTRSIALVNARVVVVDGGEAASLRFGSRVLGVDDPALRHDVRVDLGGAVVLPGLVNGHDHLALNHFGEVRFRHRHRNAAEWIDDVDPRLETDEHLKMLRQVPRPDAVLIGGLKNVLAGVTTVVHHDPAYPELARAPIRTLKRYGWAHSFYLHERQAGKTTGDVRSRADAAVASAYRQTGRDAPFIVHLAEGTDDRAAGELTRLASVGALGDNSVVVHGVGLTDVDCASLARAGASLVWCPASNLRLLGQTAPIRALLECRGAAERIALGTDSRLTGSRDLLDELQLADRLGLACRGDLLRMVTVNARRVFRLDGAGALARGGPADLVVLPASSGTAADALIGCCRSDIRLVMCDGRPVMADRDLANLFEARGVAAAAVTLDGAPKLLDARLARRLRRSTVKEPGLEV